MKVPPIPKAWPDGRVETVVTAVDGIPLQAPNDLTFGPGGRLYFTDPADYLPNDRGPGRVFALMSKPAISGLPLAMAAFTSGRNLRCSGAASSRV